MGNQGLQIRYLNTDLDLSGTQDLRLLAEAFESEGVFPLHVEQSESGSWHATLETEEQYDDPESNIAVMLSVIEKFDTPEKNIWQNLNLREFNIGYDCGIEPWAFNQGLSKALLQRVAEVGASLRVTLYPPESLREKGKRMKSLELLELVGEDQQS